MEFAPVLSIHTTFALSAVVLSPMALWGRLGRNQRPRWHRAAGYAWITCMLGTALSALFIPSMLAWRVAGLGPIHRLMVLTLAALWRALLYLVQGHVRGHRLTMLSLYISACLVTGLFTLLPNRMLGELVWGNWLGWL